MIMIDFDFVISKSRWHPLKLDRASIQGIASGETSGGEFNGLLRRWL